MNIMTIGMLVKKERKATGLSQKALAAASHVSRVTIVNLEKGNVGDIGIVKLSAIANVIDLPIFSSGHQKDYAKIALGNINTSYTHTMDIDALEKVMLTGKIAPGFEAQIVHLIDETPTAIVAGAVKQIANKNHVKPQLIWRNLSSVAREIQSPNQFWSNIE